MLRVRWNFPEIKIWFSSFQTKSPKVTKFSLFGQCRNYFTIKIPHTTNFIRIFLMIKDKGGGLCTCWWTSVMESVNCRNTLTVARTTAPLACWSLSSNRFIMSKISLLSDGTYFTANSSMRHCAHSLNSLILQWNTTMVRIFLSLLRYHCNIKVLRLKVEGGA